VSDKNTTSYESVLSSGQGNLGLAIEHLEMKPRRPVGGNIEESLLLLKQFKLVRPRISSPNKV